MIDNDWEAFFSDFAVTVEVLRTGFIFKALLDAPVHDSHMGILDFSGSAPFLTCRSEDASGLEREELISIVGLRQYRIKSSRKDIASGLSILQLVED